jgi:hypothetical protein
MTCNKNLCGVTYPSDFIPKIHANKLNTRVVFTLEVTQTFTTTKTQTKVVLDVCCLEFLLSMAIMLPIHALHWFPQVWVYKFSPKKLLK